MRPRTRAGGPPGGREQLGDQAGQNLRFWGASLKPLIPFEQNARVLLLPAWLPRLFFYIRWPCASLHMAYSAYSAFRGLRMDDRSRSCFKS
jgi:hypothetical protein